MSDQLLSEHFLRHAASATSSAAAPEWLDARVGAMVAGAELPQADQSAWQRWELASFGDNRPAALARAEAEKAARSALTSQLARQIGDSRDAARLEGHEQGRKEGQAQGYAQGLAEGRLAAEAEGLQLQTLASSFSTALAGANAAVAQDLLSLALDIAKAMLKTSLSQRPELLLPLVSELIREMPAGQGPSTLLLQADDAALVQAHLSGQLEKDGWRIRIDHQLQRGGCRIETATQQVDADIAVRWQRIARTLGQDLRWLDDTDKVSTLAAAHA